MTNEEFVTAVKGALRQAYHAYLDGLKKDETPSEDQILAITNEALTKIIKVIDSLPVASRNEAGKLALAITMRVAFQMFNVTHRIDIERAERRRRPSPN